MRGRASVASVVALLQFPADRVEKGDAQMAGWPRSIADLQRPSAAGVPRGACVRINWLSPGSAGSSRRDERLLAPGVIKWREQRAPKFGHDLGQRFEVTGAISGSECSPVCLSTFVLNEAFAEPTSICRWMRALVSILSSPKAHYRRLSNLAASCWTSSMPIRAPVTTRRSW
jgi:hypothetical protein